MSCRRRSAASKRVSVLFDPMIPYIVMFSSKFEFGDWDGFEAHVAHGHTDFAFRMCNVDPLPCSSDTTMSCRDDGAWLVFVSTFRDEGRYGRGHVDFDDGNDDIDNDDGHGRGDRAAGAGAGDGNGDGWDERMASTFDHGYEVIFC